MLCGEVQNTNTYTFARWEISLWNALKVMHAKCKHARNK